MNKLKVLSDLKIDGVCDDFFYDGDGYGLGEDSLVMPRSLSGDGSGCSAIWCKSLNGNGYGYGEGSYSTLIMEGDGAGYEYHADKVSSIITYFCPSDF